MGLFRKKQHEQVRQPHISDDNDSYAFRRSRTMTGSLSDSVRAAAEPRADLQSDRLKTHTLRKKRRHLFTYLAATVCVVVGLVTILDHFMLSVHVTADQGISASEATTYQAAINSYLSSHPNERFSFSLNDTALTQTLQKQFPELYKVSLTPEPWLKPAIAHVTLRQPVASWTIGTTKYYIDGTGVAFQRIHGPEPTLIVEDRTGIDPASNNAIASERMIHYIGRLVGLLTQAGYSVSKVELPPLTSREVDVYLAGKAYGIKTSLDRDPAGQVADIKNAINYLTSKNISPSYADVRVSSRLYYK